VQAADERVRSLVGILTGVDEQTNETNDEIDGYQVTDGILYKIHNGRLLLVIPKAMRKGIVITAHDYAGHFSVDRTVARILNDYWFLGLKRYVEKDRITQADVKWRFTYIKVVYVKAVCE